MSTYDEARVRHGKTRRDHQSGAHRRRMENNDIRAEWCRTDNSKRETTRFPHEVCNGKKTRRLRGEK